MYHNLEHLINVIESNPDKMNSAVRDAIEHVLWADYTGFSKIDDLSKPEKTIIGTCIERTIRKEFNIPLSKFLDIGFADGSFADIKTTCNNNWMIPRECVGQMCLLVKVSDDTYSVGIFKAEEGLLTEGRNQDKKRSVSAKGKKTIEWILREEEY